MEVVSDSTYVVNCFRQRWWAGWHRRGWRNAQGKPVANRTCGNPCSTWPSDPQARISFALGEGSLGRPLNDLVDQLAVAAATAGRGAAG